MHFDDLMTILGEFGRYQKIRFSMLCVVTIICAWHSFNMVFIGAAPQFHCNIKTINVSGTPLEGLTLTQKEKLLIPVDSDCYQYELMETVRALTAIRAWSNQSSKLNQTPWHYDLPPLLENVTRSTEACTNGVTFSQDIFSNTITSEFHLVCSRKFWRSLAMSMFFAGRSLGALIFGQSSDRYGRRPIFFMGCLLLLLSGIGASLSPSMAVFLLWYFCQGAALTGVVLVNFTMVTEMVGPRYRVIAGFTIQILSSIGYISLAGIAFCIRDWRYLELAITLPLVLFGAYWWFLPESMRWLISKGRDAEAKAVIRSVAATNGTSIDVDILNSVIKKAPMASMDTVKNYNFFDCLRTWKMAQMSLNVWFNWLVISLVYYGLSLNTENLGGNPYLNFCITAAVEIPAHVICILILDKVGRRGPLVLSMLFGGVACILSGYIPKRQGMETLTTVLAIFGKFGITAAYGIIYLMTAELFPTVIRNIGMGVSSMSARLGGTLAPLILDLQWYSKPLPLYIFGGLSIFSGLLALFLPETAGKPLAQLPEDMDHGPSLRNVLSFFQKRKDNSSERDGYANDKKPLINSSEKLTEERYLLQDD